MRYKVFVLCVLVLGLALLAVATHDLKSLDGRFDSPVNFFLWMAMITIVSMAPIPRSRGRLEVALTPALDLAAILVFGTAVACWMGVLSRLISNTTERWNPLPPALLRLAQAGVAIGAAGFFYQALGGSVGTDFLGSGSRILAVAGAGGAYLLVNAVITTLHHLLGGPTQAGRHWTAELRERAGSEAIVLPFGGLVAFTQLRIGSWGVAIFLLPLLLIRYVFKLWIEIKRSHVDTVRTLMAAVDATDPTTRGHAYRISKMCVRVARHMGMPEREVEQLEYAALLHDIGRTAIQRDLLTKSGALTAEEHSILRAHPKIGADMLRRLRFFEEAAEIVHAHHEQPDGKGYPLGLAGEEIPLGSRIIMVVAAFDAMTSDRPYRRGLSPEAAFEELLSHSGTQFFTPVVEALIQLYSEGVLFEEFEGDELERYEQGLCNSRALDEYLKRHGTRGTVPVKLRGDAGEAGVPVIEFPVPAEVAEACFPPAPDSEVRLNAAAATDVGCVRENNEDCYGMNARPDTSRGALLVLADGMGGEAAGEIASSLAVETVREVYYEGMEGVEAPEALRRAMEMANQAILSRAGTDASLAGMGTTCTAAVFLGRDLWIGHIGDSRAYLVANDSITLLTRDHTLAAELADMAGTRGVGGGGARNVLTRCLGSSPEIEVDMPEEPVTLEAGDTVVLCSDGLSNLVDPDEIREAVGAGPPAKACRSLVRLARERGGPDNITVQVARVEAA